VLCQIKTNTKYKYFTVQCCQFEGYFFSKNQYFERLSNNKMTLVYGVSSSKKFCLFEFLYRELSCKSFSILPIIIRSIEKGRKNLLEVTNGSISINYGKTSMVVAVLTAYREQSVGLLYKCKWYNITNPVRVAVC
jgi:hypothetical protein